jgi:Ca-activated chloride channel family protein
MISFLNPLYLLLLIFIPLLYWYKKSNYDRHSAHLQYSTLRIISSVVKFSDRKRAVLDILKLSALGLAVIAFARPRAGIKTEEVKTKGTDIMLCLDTSTSMRALDFKPMNRFDAAKKAAIEFVKGRKYDRIGVVVFAGISFIQCPLTVDHGAVVDFLEKSEIGMTQVDGTAIGTALSTAVNRMKDSEAKSKVIILLTDGRNNMGEIDPITAANLAQSFDIKVYTIGCGIRGPSLYPIEHPLFGIQYVPINEEIDEDTLIRIASITGGKYFRATSPRALYDIYKEIDSLEKTEFKVEEYTEYRELFVYFLFPALLLFLASVILENSYLMKIP